MKESKRVAYSRARWQTGELLTSGAIRCCTVQCLVFVWYLFTAYAFFLATLCRMQRYYFINPETWLLPLDFDLGLLSFDEFSEIQDFIVFLRAFCIYIIFCKKIVRESFFNKVLNTHSLETSGAFFFSVTFRLLVTIKWDTITNQNLTKRRNMQEKKTRIKCINRPFATICHVTDFPLATPYWRANNVAFPW